MRTLAEWLVVPLVLLPILAAGGLALLARDAHERDLAPYREHGASAATRWLEAGDIHAMLLRRNGLYKVRIQAISECEEGVPITHPAGAAFVVHPRDHLGDAAWAFAAEEPGGILAGALEDPSVRMQIESGRAPFELGAVTEEGRAFAALYAAFDLDRLRAANLPCDSKRFLVMHHLDMDPADDVLRAAARFLERVGAYECALAALPTGLGRGTWSAGDLHILVDDSQWPRIVTWDAEVAGNFPLVLEADGSDSVPVRLVWAFPTLALPTENIVWTGRLDAPFAGSYAFQAKHGLAWWQSSRVRRWGGPVLAGALVTLGIAIALLVHLRRRRHLDEARLRFLNELAHDLRTPLTSLRLHADLLAGDRARPEKREGYVARMSVEAGRLSALLANLLDLTRLERGKRAFSPEPVSLPDLAQEATREFAAVFPERASDVDAENVVGVIRADRAALARVLVNLLENAGKFTPRGTPIRIRTRPAASGLDLIVEDEGPGIPQAERRRVFNRYARGEAAKRDGVPGTGLGLALVKDLVEGMGGRVSLVEGARGTTIAIHLEEAADA